MSTKRLDRTVIEGGRYGRNKWERRESHKTLRAAEKNYLADILKDPDNFDEEIIEEIKPVYKEFSDKLRPMYRWLKAQVGRKWSEVRSEVFQKFDTKTTAGRHITFDHLLSSVVDTRSGWDDRGRVAANQTSYSERYLDFFVDDNDILRICPISKHGRYYYLIPMKEFETIGNWLNGRMIGEKGGILHWFIPNDGIWKCLWSREMEKTKYGNREGSLGLKYYTIVNGTYQEKLVNSWGFQQTLTRSGEYWKWIENPAGFKQRGPLTEEEAKYFRSLDKKIKEEILSFGKVRF